MSKLTVIIFKTEIRRHLFCF